ncbi:hypothetical protein RQP46_011368 [Phenoliferia psychrophenolica]
MTSATTVWQGLTAVRMEVNAQQALQVFGDVGALDVRVGRTPTGVVPSNWIEAVFATTEEADKFIANFDETFWYRTKLSVTKPRPVVDPARLTWQPLYFLPDAGHDLQIVLVTQGLEGRACGNKPGPGVLRPANRLSPTP